MKRTIIIKAGDTEQPAAGVGMFGCIATLLFAMAADAFQWVLPWLWFLADGAMVVILLIVWGWRWEIAVAAIPEAIPGLDLFPTWTLFVGYLIAKRRRQVPH